ncbi:predicted protein [Streptomyces viridosporus ATCC 14672]|uniref:Predicted protein n=1 Tax=Streptomyces viridosporus (strain ATCC 14672 / DSM 40746 / JCM 4963 / KCTC 9882 / NRRL B-12104 / FH 1290) TaxID=566461 RepID=D5ZYR2_STRV1|nr:predicted protein [Streptomyces viridosporus ATCC 14672]
MSAAAGAGAGAGAGVGARARAGGGGTGPGREEGGDARFRRPDRTRPRFDLRVLDRLTGRCLTGPAADAGFRRGSVLVVSWQSSRARGLLPRDSSPASPPPV